MAKNLDDAERNLRKVKEERSNLGTKLFFDTSQPVFGSSKDKRHLADLDRQHRDLSGYVEQQREKKRQARYAQNRQAQAAELDQSWKIRIVKWAIAVIVFISAIEWLDRRWSDESMVALGLVLGLLGAVVFGVRRLQWRTVSGRVDFWSWLMIAFALTSLDSIRQRLFTELGEFTSFSGTYPVVLLFTLALYPLVRAISRAFTR